MKARILADAGPLVALLNRRDRYHAWARARFAEFTEPLLTCEAVLAEAFFLLSACPGANAALIELWRRGVLRVDFAAEREQSALTQLLRKYRDLPISFADACLIRLSELHAPSAVWTLDGHFRVYRRHGRQVIPRIMPEG